MMRLYAHTDSAAKQNKRKLTNEQTPGVSVTHSWVRALSSLLLFHLPCQPPRHHMPLNKCAPEQEALIREVGLQYAHESMVFPQHTPFWVHVEAVALAVSQLC